MNDLDIVIVNWNTGSKLQECLQSISLTNSASDFHLSKCIVVDNASNDKSANDLKGLPYPFTIIQNRENKGFAYACNQGADLGIAEYLLFLNPDIKLFPDSLTKAFLFMQKVQNKQVGILSIQLVDQKGLVLRNVSHFPTPRSLFYQMLGLDNLWPGRFKSHFLTTWDHQENREVDQVQGAYYFVRRKVFEELGGFDERFFMYFEDLDFAYRARQAGWKSYYLAEAQAIHFGGGSSNQVKARRLFYVLNSRVLYIAKHYGVIAARKILISSLIVEFWARLGWNLINLLWHNIIETIQAYSMFVRALPKLLGDIRSK